MSKQLLLRCGANGAAEWKECILFRRMAEVEENPLSANGRLVHASGWCRSTCLRRKHMDGGSSLYGLPPSHTASLVAHFRQQKQILRDFCPALVGTTAHQRFILPPSSTSLRMRMNYFWL